VRRVPFICLIIFLAPFAAAQISGHQGAITAMLMDERQKILSAGTDGFLQIWNLANNAPELRFQISPYSISSMVLRPGKPELAIVETNASGLSRISVWDYEQKRNIFTFPFSDTVSHVFYSAGGTYILVTGSAGVTLIHSESGNTLPSPGGLTGQVVFAATGASERSMITYLSSGFLRYWNLETGAMTQSVNVPRDIKSPLLLGNNRFLAGFDASGLMVLDAVSGRVILRETNIRSGTLFTGNPEGMEFICLTPGAAAINAQAASSPAVSTLYHLTIGNLNRIETLNRRNTTNTPAISAGVVVSADSAALGTVDGRVMIFSQNGSGRFMNTQAQIRIEEIAVSSGALAFRTENSRLGFIPLDYSRLNSNSVLRLEDSGPYTEISASLSGNSEFLLWQPDNTRSFPLIKRVSNSPESGSVSESYINTLTLRYPLRAVSIYRNLYLFLDTVGNIRIINQDSGSIIYDSLFSGARDAVFINERNILLARSAGTGNSAFLMVSINTGETVPLPLSADLGVKVYRGESGFIYGAAINRASNNNYRTSIVYINTANPSQSYSLTDLDAEDTLLSIAESAPFLASTLGGSGASIYRIPGINSSVSNSIYQGTAMERSAGFPKKIISGGSYFISLDSDGNITWHDPGTGKILALFRIYAGTWVMEAGGNITRGRIQG
jgi:WD40 repeat protein